MISAVNWEGVAYLEEDYDDWELTPPQYDGNLPDPLEAYRYRHDSIPIRPYDQPMFTFKLDAYCGRSCLCGSGAGYTSVGERGFVVNPLREALLENPRSGPTMAEVDALQREIQRVRDDFRSSLNTVGDAVRGASEAIQAYGHQSQLMPIMSPVEWRNYAYIDEYFVFNEEQIAALADLSMDTQMAINGEAFVVVSTNDDGSVNIKPLKNNDG